VRQEISAKLFGRERQENHESDTNLSYIVRPCIRKANKPGGRQLTTIILATWEEAEIGRTATQG
jgi:hypothetical protein